MFAGGKSRGKPGCHSWEVAIPMEKIQQPPMDTNLQQNSKGFELSEVGSYLESVKEGETIEGMGNPTARGGNPFEEREFVKGQAEGTLKYRRGVFAMARG